MRFVLTLIILALVMALVSVGLTMAATPGDASVTSETSLGEYTASSGDTNVNLEAGNITAVAINTNMSTFRWAGLFGNVSGLLVLGDTARNFYFNWTASGRMVYATNASTVTWSSLADASPAQVIAQYSYLNVSGSSDLYNNTFTGIAENINSLIFTSLTSDFATTQSTAATAWKTYSLTDGSSIIFAGRVSEDGTTYTGATADFQMILPEDGTAGDLTARTYNLWVELQ